MGESVTFHGLCWLSSYGGISYGGCALQDNDLPCRAVLPVFMYRVSWCSFPWSSQIPVTEPWSSSYGPCLSNGFLVFDSLYGYKPGCLVFPNLFGETAWVSLLSLVLEDEFQLAKLCSWIAFIHVCKKYVISGLAAYELNRHVMLEVNGATCDFMCENRSHSSMMWYYIWVTGSSVYSFDCLLSFILNVQKIFQGHSQHLSSAWTSVSNFLWKLGSVIAVTDNLRRQFMITPWNLLLSSSLMVYMLHGRWWLC